MNRTFIITLHFKGAGAFEVYVSGAARAKKDKTLQHGQCNAFPAAAHLLYFKGKQWQNDNRLL